MNTGLLESHETERDGALAALVYDLYFIRQEHTAALEDLHATLGVALVEAEHGEPVEAGEGWGWYL